MKEKSPPNQYSDSHGQTDMPNTAIGHYELWAVGRGFATSDSDQIGARLVQNDGAPLRSQNLWRAAGRSESALWLGEPSPS